MAATKLLALLIVFMGCRADSAPVVVVHPDVTVSAVRQEAPASQTAPTTANPQGPIRWQEIDHSLEGVVCRGPVKQTAPLARQQPEPLKGETCTALACGYTD